MVILIPTWITALYVALIHRVVERPQPTEMWIATAIVTLFCAVLA
jgi:hypothetical protein